MGPLPIENVSASLPASSTQPAALRQENEEKTSLLAPKERSSTSTDAITKEELVEPIQRINDIMRPRGLEFDISEQSARIITRVIDKDTGDIIRQIPAKEVLLLAEQLEEMSGKLLSEKA